MFGGSWRELGFFDDAKMALSNRFETFDRSNRVDVRAAPDTYQNRKHARQFVGGDVFFGFVENIWLTAQRKHFLGFEFGVSRRALLK